MSADLLVIVPTRGRAENVKRLLDGWTTTTTGRADLVLCTDDDDPTDLRRFLGGTWPYGEKCWQVTGPRRGLCAWTNIVAAEMAGEYAFLGSIGDDHLPRTAGWDERVCGELERLGTGVVYGDDLLRGARLCTAAFLTSDIVATLGYMVPPEIEHLYCDEVWMAWGGELGLSYLPDVVIEHLHPFAGKAEMDESYRSSNSSGSDSRDEAAFGHYGRAVRRGRGGGPLRVVLPPTALAEGVADGPEVARWPVCVPNTSSGYDSLDFR